MARPCLFLGIAAIGCVIIVSEMRSMLRELGARHDEGEPAAPRAGTSDVQVARHDGS